MQLHVYLVEVSVEEIAVLSFNLETEMFFFFFSFCMHTSAAPLPRPSREKSCFSIFVPFPQ